MYQDEGNYNKLKILGKSFKFVRRGNALGLYIDIRDIPPALDPIWQEDE
jgi:hypothetical protein